MKKSLLFLSVAILSVNFVNASFLDFLDTNYVNATNNVSIGSGNETFRINSTAEENIITGSVFRFYNHVTMANSLNISHRLRATYDNDVNPHFFGATLIETESGNALKVTGDTWLNGDVLHTGEGVWGKIAISTAEQLAFSVNNNVLFESDLDVWGQINGSDVCDEDEGICLNNTQARVTGTCSVGSSIRIIASDGTVTCETDSDTTYSENSLYLTQTGTVFGFNETKLNLTIDARDDVGGAGGNPFDQELNTTSNVTFNDMQINGSIGINTAPSASYRIYFSDQNVTEGLSVMNFDVRQNVNLFSPMQFSNKLIRDSGNPIARVLQGTVSTTKDLSTVQTMTGIYMTAGDNGDTAQTQGTRKFKAIEIITDNPGIMSGGTVEQVGIEYTGMQDFQSGGTINEYGARFTKNDDIDFGTGTSNHYGIYLDNWGKGATEDLSYSIYVDEGNVHFEDDLNVEGFAEYKTPLGGFFNDDEGLGPVNISLPSSGVFYNFTNLNKSLINVGETTYFTIDESLGTVTFTPDGSGIYSFFLSMSFQSTRTGTYHCAVFTNYTTKEEVSFERSIGTINSVGDASDQGYVNVSPNDVLNVQCETGSGANPMLTADHLSFGFERVSR